MVNKTYSKNCHSYYQKLSFLTQTTMGHGDHFVADRVYGVGIAAHGDDSYRLGHASLYQGTNVLLSVSF